MLPTLADLQKFAVVNGSSMEVVRQSLYDFQLYPTAGQTNLTFYAVPVGQGTTSSTGATGAKTYADTNMLLAGQLPRYQNFIVDSIEIYFEPGSVSTANTFTKQSITQFAASASAALAANANDLDSIRQTGWLELFVVQKNYLREAPLGRFPTKTYLGLDAAVGNSSTAAAGAIVISSPKLAGRPYYVEPHVALPENANFSVTLLWPAAVATPSGFNGRMGIVMDGFFYRATQ